MSNSEKKMKGKLADKQQTAIFLRLIVAVEVHHLLPYGHLLYAQLKGEELTLVYAVHEVRIRGEGESLEGIFENIQDLRLCELSVQGDDGLTEITVRYRDEAWLETLGADATEDED